jgi:hypothetical protein
MIELREPIKSTSQADASPLRQRMTDDMRDEANMPLRKT